jgi:hypothetical protein
MDDSAQTKCEVCGARVGELRRGRCWGCYLRWAEARPVGLGAACVICSERRRDNLRMIELLGKSQPMCHNCASKVTRLLPMPRTIEGIRDRLERDRRREERREGQRDHRIFARERRVGERRTPARDGVSWLDEDYLIEIVEELDIDVLGTSAPLGEGIEMTTIRPLAEPAPEVELTTIRPLPEALGKMV